MTDAATGNVKLITELSGTTQFLKHLGLLYDSFGITCKGTIAQHITPQQMETTTTNGPQGTVSQKTQQSAQLLLRGVRKPSLRKHQHNKSRNCDAHRLESTLLTTIVRNPG